MYRYYHNISISTFIPPGYSYLSTAALNLVATAVAKEVLHSIIFGWWVLQLYLQATAVYIPKESKSIKTAIFIES